MTPPVLYSVCLLGAAGLYLLMRSGGRNPLKPGPLHHLGALIGLAALGWLLVGAGAEAAGAAQPGFFLLLFAVLAVASAAKMITTPRPVYAALYFVLVVLASAGLFLLLEAEFMAFALVIVYAGAVVITYMFVIMLAQQAPDPNDPAGQAEYDLRPREPLAGAVVGFVLLALLARTAVDGAIETLPRVDAATARIESWESLRHLPRRLRDAVAPDVPVLAEDGLPMLEIAADGIAARVIVENGAGELADFYLPETMRPDNIQSVGLGLIRDFPASLEIAGIILLMAMFGAVILARRQTELSEDDKREAAGLRRFGHHDDDEAATSAGEAS